MPNSGQSFDTPLFPDPQPAPGSCNDDSLIRGLITDAIRRSPRSREEIADEMTRLLGEKISASQLNTYTAESKQHHRWPLAWTRAFCYATSDFRLVIHVAERSGFVAITPEEVRILELGRQYLARQSAADNVARLEAELRGRS